MPKQARHVYTYGRSKGLLRGIPGPIHITSQPTPSTLTPWGCSCLSICLSSATRTGGGEARAMRDAGYAHRRGEGARSDQQPPAANHCQLASQPKELWGSKSRAVANGAEKNPPFRCGSGTTAVTSSSLLDPACARCGYLRAPLAVSRPCAFAPCLVREGGEGKKEVKKNCWCLSDSAFLSNSS